MSDIADKLQWFKDDSFVYRLDVADGTIGLSVVKGKRSSLRFESNEMTGERSGLDTTKVLRSEEIFCPEQGDISVNVTYMGIVVEGEPSKLRSYRDKMRDALNNSDRMGRLAKVKLGSFIYYLR